jgi:hypothetical protein
MRLFIERHEIALDELDLMDVEELAENYEVEPDIQDTLEAVDEFMEDEFNRIYFSREGEYANRLIGER